MKNIALIGSTGSIGRQTIEVALSSPDKFRIVAMAAGGSHALFMRQMAEVKPRFCALADELAAKKVTEVPQGVRFCGGRRAALDVAAYDGADVVVIAASGFAGLEYALAAIEAGKTVALANKETLVCGGDYVMPLARRKGVSILPVDSEHSAIWQCLGFNAEAPFAKLIITASGGPFRNFTDGQLKEVTPQMALSHPTWRMGPKITVDSATLLNKGFEVIEAHHLFGAQYSDMEVVIHPQSIVHSMVRFRDGACLAQLSVPTMKIPIQMALTYPERFDCGAPPLDFSRTAALEFYPLESGRFPCFDLAAECGRAGGILPCVLNAAGEVAVKAFLDGKLRFTDIARVAEQATAAAENRPAHSFAALEEADRSARVRAEQAVRLLSF